MALTQALSTGISGLMTHQKALDNIGNNLANVNTVGFKKGVYQFTTLLEQTLRGGMTADAQTGRGSINPISMGMGTQTGSINKVFTQGPIENTGNPNDMAIDGNGFFVLRQGDGFVYSRAGSFYRGEDGSLMAANGLYVQGTMAVKNGDGSITIPQDAKLQNIVIPIGTTGGQAQTSQVSSMGNLDSRQQISTGTRLFGGSSFPSVNNLQKWMWKDFNGGDPVTSGKKVDTSWNALENTQYAVSKETLTNWGVGTAKMPTNVAVYGNSVVSSFNPASTTACASAVLDITNGKILSAGDITGNAARSYATMAEIQNYMAVTGIQAVPLIQEVQVINGGNVQTSAAYAVETPDVLPKSPPQYLGSDGKFYNIKNDHTYPQWFYESTGGNFARAAALSNNAFDVANPANTAAAINSIWPNGFNNDPSYWGATPTVNSLPRKGETFPASLNTPLEQLRYQKGNTWVQPFAGISNGKEVNISFKKGDAQINATFVYNRPQGPETFNGQVSIGQEKSYTLEHFLKFMAGDVDRPTVACQNITPAMFGAPVTKDYPDGDFNQPNWDRDGYETALKNVKLATSEGNLDSVGGAMGLLSIPPQISTNNYGESTYDAPPESAGAFSRTGVQNNIVYKRYDSTTGKLVDVKGDSFNTSFVSNLGTQNALSDIRISYNNVTQDAMYKAETQYNAPQGGSSSMTVDFYDSLGNPKQATVRLALVSQDSDFTTWRWYADSVDDSDFPWQTDPETGEIISNLNVGTGLIRFDKEGNYVPGSDYSESGGITINLNNQGVNDPIVIGILNNLSAGVKQDLDFSELTCTATSNSFKLKSQNGRPPGTLNDFTVGLDGVIQGIYSNGAVVPIARIGLAVIPNENGLIAAGNNLFYVGPASGDAQYGHANTGGNGSIRHMQLESSNVDLSEEFTKLISTERGFQANSRTITTADNMIQELLNLKR